MNDATDPVLNKYTRTCANKTPCMRGHSGAWLGTNMHPLTDQVSTSRLSRDDSTQRQQHGECDGASLEFEEREDSEGGCAPMDVGQ